MANKKQVLSYAIAAGIIRASFPNREIRCQHCPFCRGETDLKRFWCRLINRLIYDPFAEGLPEFCPLEVQVDENGEILAIPESNLCQED